MTTIKFNSQAEMVGYLKTIGTTAMFISLHSVTKFKLNKFGIVNGVKQKNPYHDKIRKVSKRNGLLNVNYHKSWTKRLAKKTGMTFAEADKETVAGTTWYTHVFSEEGKALPLCVHKNDNTKFYLQYFPLKSQSVLVDENDQPIDKSLLKPYLPAEKEESDKPAVCVFGMDSIKVMKCRKLKVKTETVSDLNSLPEITVDLSEKTQMVPA